MYRVLADRLVRAGVDVLRFDYFATGDSAGDDAEGDLEGWTEDVRSADAELVRRSDARRVVWIGTRLGATLAIRASAMRTHALERLILWEPVIDGRGYLQEIAKRHLQTLTVSYNVPQPAHRQRMEGDAATLEREGIGFELGDRFRAQVAALSPSVLPTPRALHCDVIERDARSAVIDMVDRWRQAGRVANTSLMTHDFDWMAAEALSTALVPAQAIQLLHRLAADAQ
jgi:pimeloyl-ACP methyl ester carboxylesterase